MAWPNSLFPGVYSRLVSTSFGIASSGASTGFIAFMSEKGKDNQLVSLGSTSELLSTFGEINASKYGAGMLVLSNWFIAASSAYAVRVLPDTTNLPCQTNIYEGVWGSYSVGKIKMKEAAYANLVISVNSLNKIELTNIGPVYYGELQSVSLTTPPTSPTVGDMYAIPYGGTAATDAWAGKEGYIAECQQSTPTVVWQFEEIGSIGYATVKDTSMSVAVNYVPLSTKLKTWKVYGSNDFGDSYTVVKDVLNVVPESPADGDAYYIGSPAPTSGVWADRVGQVATWSSSTSAWVFTIPNTVVISKSYTIAASMTADSTTAGKTYLTSTSASGDWADHQGVWATCIASTTTGENGSTTTYAWSYILPSVATDGTQVAEIIIQSLSDNTFYKYTSYSQTKKTITWSTDMDATFPSYIRRTAEIKSVLSTSTPDTALTDNTTEPLFIIYGIGRGTYYNNVQVSMSLSAKSQFEDTDYNRTLMLDVYDTNSGSKLLLESFEVSLNPEATDAQSDASLYIVNVLNTYSKLIRCKAVDAAYLTSTQTYMTTANTQVDALFSAYEKAHVVGNVTYSPALANGTNGNLFKDNGSLDWTVAKAILAKAYTGTIINPDASDPTNPYLTDVLDTEMVLIDLVFDAGYPYAVKTAIIDLITARDYDCIGIVDMLDNASAEAAYKARTDSTGVGKQFNTPYIAIYEPYTNVYDKYSGTNIWVTPVFHAARAFATTDRNYGRHYAPAGINRGMCYGINEMRYNLYRENSYKDKFVSYCINPIICNKSGYVIYGQSTSYLKVSKFQDINVIRPIIEIERDLKSQLQNMLFEFNDKDTYTAIDNAVRSYLGNKMSNKVIESYSCEVVATDYDVQTHKCEVNLTIVPKQCIYQILVTISV